MSELLNKYAKMIVNIGVNVQKGQDLFLNTPVEAIELAREIVKEAYLKGARKVTVNYSDALISRYNYEYMNEEVLEYVPNHVVEYYNEICKVNGCVVSITSPDSSASIGLDPKKIMKSSVALGSKITEYKSKMSSSILQWCVVAYPNKNWAEKVFPNEKDAVTKLLSAILTASRITDDNDPVEEWKKHVEILDRRSKMLNDYNFDKLHFKNSLGTDLYVGLVENHIWAGGKELSASDVVFLPNMPTEEVFTMPHKYNVNGTVRSTLPLFANGTLIEDFTLTFKDGKVVSATAKSGLLALESLLDSDENSRYLGEVALISHNSPISNMGILFYNTLLDENASCHLALGNAYPMNIKGGTIMSKEELSKNNANTSVIHVDFMFGSADMEVDGIKKNGEKVALFRKGSFII